MSLTRCGVEDGSVVLAVNAALSEGLLLPPPHPNPNREKMARDATTKLRVVTAVTRELKTRLLPKTRMNRTEEG
jgi:hypothetical protein